MGAVDDAKVWALIAEARGMPYGPGRMEATEAAVRLADVREHVELRYAARMAALEAAVFGGYPERALVVFGWLAAICEREPDRFPESRVRFGFITQVDLLWAYKWVVQHTPGFHEISRPQIEGTLAEMERRYARNGLSMRPVWASRARVGMELGAPPEQIAEYHHAWQLAEQDAYADCEACEQSLSVEVYRYLGRWEAEVAAAQPLLRGEMSCAEVPHTTVSNLVMSMWQHGELEEAARLHRWGYELCHDNRDFLGELAEHLDYRIVTGDVDGAMELARFHVAWVAEARSGRRRWRWFLSLGELFARMAARGESMWPLPATLGSAEARGSVQAAAAWFAAETDRLASLFDARNGNDAVSRWTAELRGRLAA